MKNITLCADTFETAETLLGDIVVIRGGFWIDCLVTPSQISLLRENGIAFGE